MNILTKLFVVLVTIMAVALVAMVVPFVVNQENYQGQIGQLRTEKRALEAAVAQARHDQVTVANQIEIQRRTQEAEILRLNALLREAAQNLQGERDRVTELTRSSEQLQREVSTANATARQSTDMYNKVRAEFDGQSKQLAELRAQFMQQAEALSRKESENLKLVSQVRQMEEIVHSRERELEQLTRRIQTLPPDQLARLMNDATSLPPFSSDVAIQGAITRVDEEAGEVFLQINLGRTDNVRENMKFMVHRNGNFLGNLIITAVDQRTATGYVRLRQEGIRTGDRVYSGPSNPS